jgi:hypothetical protein
MPLVVGLSCVVAIFVAACLGPSEQEPEALESESAALYGSDAGYSGGSECPWASATDPSCAVGVSEKSCGGGSGKCGVSGSKGCTCITNTYSLDSGVRYP